MPTREGHGVPGTGVEDAPEDDGYEEWVGGDAGVVETVEGAKGSRPAVEENRSAGEGIAGCVDGGDEHVET